MSKVANKDLLNTRLEKAFDGHEIGFLYNVLDDHMCDWNRERRAKYEPLLADLAYLSNALGSEGRDYGTRSATRWADDIPELPQKMTVEVICYCGTRIIIVEEADVDTTKERPWVVICPRHEGPAAKVLGTITVRGEPESELHAKLAVQQFLASQESSMRDGSKLQAHVNF